jgi:hypothetical protein
MAGRSARPGVLILLTPFVGLDGRGTWNHGSRTVYFIAVLEHLWNKNAGQTRMGGESALPESAWLRAFASLRFPSVPVAPYQL